MQIIQILWSWLVFVLETLRSCWQRKKLFCLWGWDSQGFLFTVLHHHHHRHQSKYARIEMSHLWNGGQRGALLDRLIPSLAELKALMANRIVSLVSSVLLSDGCFISCFVTLLLLSFLPGGAAGPQSCDGWGRSVGLRGSRPRSSVGHICFRVDGWVGDARADRWICSQLCFKSTGRVWKWHRLRTGRIHLFPASLLLVREEKCALSSVFLLHNIIILYNIWWEICWFITNAPS